MKYRSGSRTETGMRNFKSISELKRSAKCLKGFIY